MAQKPDTIQLVLTHEKTITNETVRMTVPVNAAIGDRSEDEVRAEIREALMQFIKTDWQFSHIRRGADQAGGEHLSLIATARVPEAENARLEQRTRDLGKRGQLRVGTPQVDHSFPLTKLEKERDAVRLALIARAIEQCRTITEATGRAYRLGHIEFESGTDSTSNAPRAFAASAPSTYDSVGDGAALGHSEKLIMVATVTLRARPE